MVSGADPRQGYFYRKPRETEKHIHIALGYISKGRGELVANDSIAFHF